MRSPTTVILVVCIAIASRDLLSAQSRVLVFGQIVAEANLATGPTRSFPHPGDDCGSFTCTTRFAVSGGRYVVWLGTTASPGNIYTIRALDTRSGTTFTAAELPPPGYTGNEGFAGLAGDPNRARVFVWHADTIASLGTAGFRFIANATPTGEAGTVPSRRLMAYAPVADILFVTRQNGAAMEIAQYDPAGGLLRSFPLSAAVSPSLMAVTFDARRVFALFHSLASGYSVISYDAETGGEVGTVTIPDDSLVIPVSIVLDETRERVIISRASLGYVDVHDFGLTMLQQIKYPGQTSLCRFDVALVDLGMGSVIASIPFTGIDPAHGCVGGGSVILSPPAAPELLAPVVSGTTVTLTWSPTVSAIDYQIEAGDNPHSASFIARSAGRTSMTFGSVPPGEYYVRLRALNDIGLSAASAAVTLTIK